MSDNEELYVSGFVNCLNCNSFLTDFNQCSKCQRRLCNDCCKELKGKSCPFCHKPFYSEKNQKMERLIKNIQSINCKYCKKEFKSVDSLRNHECIKEDLSCRFCKYISKDDNEFLNHITERHKEEIMELMNEEK